jgi:signal transduction histidine kinase
VRTFLAGKYRDRPPDVIVAIADPAIRLVLDWPDAPWPGCPLVFAAANRATVNAALASGRAAGVVVTLDAEGTLRAALALVPGADEVVVVAGRDIYLPLVERAIAGLGRPLRVTRLVDLPLEETRQRLAGLPPTSFVYYSQITVDGEGRGLFGRRSLEELAPASSRPIFSHYGTFLGHGIAGGSLLDAEVVGRETAGLARLLLAGARPSAIAPVTSRSNRLRFDWRELQRFGLDEGRVPPGSEVLFRTPSLLEAHRGAVMTAAVLLTVQAGLIVALAAAVQRRRMAQRKLRLLSGRILTAQEDERRRIARELHDGASQDLALFAIDLDQMASGVSAPEEVPVQARAAAGRARDLSRELHRIAYELHPAILDQLGLVPALRQFADQLGTRHALRVEVRDSNWPTELSPEVTLALFRVAQEALQNAAKHSGTDEARVELVGSSKGVMLLVSDGGRGFDVAAPLEVGSLGLAGMKERLRLVGGELCVDAAPGRGTTIAAAVPRESLAEERRSRVERAT